MTSRWPGGRTDVMRSSFGSPVKLGSSLRPRATTNLARAKQSSRGHAAAALVRYRPRASLPRRIL
eukprot:6146114-Alexandrium_andersonii.AAC.1